MKRNLVFSVKKKSYTCSDDDFSSQVCWNCFKQFDQNIITFVHPYLVTNNVEEECGSNSRENDDNNSSYDRFNENFNDDDPEININDFSVTSQNHYVILGYLYLLSLYNDDTEEFIIPTDFIPTTKS